MLDGMTNIKASEVLKELKMYSEDLPHYSPDEVAEALEMAIKLLEQPPCEDAISREEALKVMCDKCPMYNCVTGCSSYRHIEKMPSVTPSYNSIKTELEQQTKWIPVSKRLPKRGEIVLWCNKDGRVFTSAITYQTKTIFSVGKHHDVIAWMPLPQPYKAESEDEE